MERRREILQAAPVNNVAVPLQPSAEPSCVVPWHSHSAEEPWMRGLWSDLCWVVLTSLPHSSLQLWPLQGLRSSSLSKAQVIWRVLLDVYIRLFHCVHLRYLQIPISCGLHEPCTWSSNVCHCWLSAKQQEILKSASYHYGSHLHFALEAK